MRPLRTALALAALVVALVAALLALDVRAWRDELDAADARFVVGGREDWQVGERLPRAPAARVLGVGDDRRVRVALRRFRTAYRLAFDPLSGQESEGARGAAERALAYVAAAGDARAASQASVLLGVLTFDQPDGSDRAVGLFTNALKLDASNAAAKYDLELALRVLRPAGARPGETGTGPSRGRPRGAGAGEAGGGY